MFILCFVFLNDHQMATEPLIIQSLVATDMALLRQRKVI